MTASFIAEVDFQDGCSKRQPIMLLSLKIGTYDASQIYTSTILYCTVMYCLMIIMFRY